MKNLTNKRILNIFTICIIILVPLLLNISFYLQVNNIIKNHSSMNPSIVIWFCIPILMYVYIKDIIDKKRKLDIHDYIFYALILIGILVSVFAINPRISIIGVQYRHEGFLSLLGYYLLFINWKVNGTEEDIKKYIKIFIIIGIANSIFALLQIYTPFRFIIRYGLDPNMASGLSGNPNFFGSLIVMLLGLVAAKFLMEEKINKKLTFILVLFIIALQNCQSTGPVLTYIIVILFLILFLKYKNKLVYKKIIYLILISIFVFVTSSFLNKLVKNNRCELCDIKETVDSGGNGRLAIWKNTIDVVKKYPILGVGYDNLVFAYPNPKQEVYFYITNNHTQREDKGGGLYIDNGHNVYLHTLATSGILGLLSLLILLLFTFIHGLKSNNKLVLILLGGFVAYSIQAFANISVIEVAPIYYIIIGLILSDKNKDKSLT